MECLRMAVAKGFCLLATILLLAMAGRCHGVPTEQSRLGSIEEALKRLNSEVQEQAVASEIIMSELKTLASLISTDHLVCEEGWVKRGSSCYFISQYTSNWDESRLECINKNSDLVKITHDEEYNFLLDRVKGHRYYVGLSDQQEEGTFRWVADCTFPSVVKSSWWKEGEPNNCKSCTSDTAGEDCVHYGALGDGFIDVSCTMALRFICEKPAQLV